MTHPRDTTTSHGTVKGHHAKPGDVVAEGGRAPSPTEGGHGHAKAAESNAPSDASPTDDTSSATAGSAEKAHAQAMGSAKTQSGRGHRKDD